LPYNWDDPKPAAAAENQNPLAEKISTNAEATGQGFVLQDATRTSIGVISQDEEKQRTSTKPRSPSTYTDQVDARFAASANNPNEISTVIIL